MLRFALYLFCLSLAGCCGMCKKGVAECTYESVRLRFERKDAGLIVDKLTVQVINDSTKTSVIKAISTPNYVPGATVKETPSLLVELHGLIPGYTYNTASVLALKHYQFMFYVNGTLITTLSNFSTAIVMVDDCNKVQCPQVLSFRDNGKQVSNDTSLLIRY